MHSTKVRNIFIIGFSLFASSWANNNLQSKYEWKAIDFNYETTAARQEAIDNKVFIPANVIPVGLDVHENRLFLSLPRLKNGVPASLAYINMDGKNSDCVCVALYCERKKKLIKLSVELVIIWHLSMLCRLSNHNSICNQLIIRSIHFNWIGSALAFKWNWLNVKTKPINVVRRFLVYFFRLKWFLLCYLIMFCRFISLSH